MSTPTTATATLPPYAAGYPFAHQSSYRQNLAGSSTRLAPPPPPQASPSASTTHYAPYSPTTVPNGVHLAAPSVMINSGGGTLPAPHTAQHATHATHTTQQHSVHAAHHPAGTMHTSYPPSHARPVYHQERADATSPNFTTSSTAVTTPTARHTYGSVTDSTATQASTAAGLSPHPTQASSRESQSLRKRRRSGPPDWETFYKNGLPQEVIVIEDTPERDEQADHRYAQPDGEGSAKAAAAAAAAAAAYHYDDADQHPSKKRRRQDDVESSGRYDPVHSYLPAPSAGGSTVSSDRTHSNSLGSLYTNTGASAAVNTAVTSIASSNDIYEFDPNALTQKRRRTTRQQLANESRKRDRDMAAAGLAYATYRPPPLPPVKASDVEVKVIHDAHYNKNIKVDDDDGHYIVIPDADLTDRYQMVKLLGQGTFGKVVQARDRRRNELVAVKIIRSVQKYRDASRIELRVLETLKANDSENRNRCIHLRECFDYRGHICIVMDLLGQSVFDFLKGNNFVPFPNSQIQSFARQLFTSVAFLHDLQLIHTDLKPENILLVDSNYQTFTYNRKIPSSSTTVARQATQRRVLLDTEIRLIDFGSATFQDEYHSSVVSTRHYRAPEIILGLGWSFPCDIWSIGCILVEFFTGDALFQTHDNLEHLAMMEAVVHQRIDSHLVQQVVRSTRHGGNPAAKYFKRLRLDYPGSETTRASRRFVRAMKKLEDIIPNSTPFMRQFLDLLRRIFVYDPAQRITAKEALQHPWFREATIQDDGTEAAKIRMLRTRESRERGSTRSSQYRS